MKASLVVQNDYPPSSPIVQHVDLHCSYLPTLLMTTHPPLPWRALRPAKALAEIKLDKELSIPEEPKGKERSDTIVCWHLFVDAGFWLSACDETNPCARH